MFHAPSTQSLLYFEASARLRSFTAVARELHLTQGAVSRQIQMLEERLSIALFVRRRDAMTLTDAGREYIAEIEPLLKRLERATVNVMTLKGRGGALSLSVGSSVGNYWLIPRLPCLHARALRDPPQSAYARGAGGFRCCERRCVARIRRRQARGPA